MKTFTKKETANILDMPDRRLLFYSEKHGLIPNLEKPVGRGISRQYTVQNIIALRVIQELDYCGITLGIMGDILFALYGPGYFEKWWDSEKEQPIPSDFSMAYYVNSKGGYTMGYPQKDIIVNLMMGKHNSAIVLMVGRMVKEILKKIA